MTREVINPEGLADSEQFGYSQAIIENGTLYASGQTAWDTDFEVRDNDIESQTRKALENVGVLLDEISKDHGDIAKVTSYVVKPHDRLEGLLSVWDDFFDSPYPAHTLVGVDQLAMEGFLVEFDIEVPLEE
jgi:enamine deaminase RidA (YjgF/YER057c/UK114 family)